MQQQAKLASKWVQRFSAGLKVFKEALAIVV